MPRDVSRHCILAAAVLLAAGLWRSWGFYSSAGLLMLMLAWGLTILALVRPVESDDRSRLSPWLWAAAFVVLTWLAINGIDRAHSPIKKALLDTAQGPTLDPTRRAMVLWPMLAVGVMGVLAALVPFARRAFVCLGGLALIVGVLFLLRFGEIPNIDVLIFQNDAAAQLLAGKNPYAMSFPSPYPDDTPYYPPGFIKNGRLEFGFPYAPVSLFAILPGQIRGDVRLAHLGWVILATLLLMGAAPPRRAAPAALLLLALPAGYYMLYMGWTEPVIAFLMAATVFAAARTPRLLFIPLGLLLASKQYMVLCTPLALLLVPAWSGRPGIDRPSAVRLAALSLAVALAVSLGLAVWDFGAFWHSVVALQFGQPFRMDALSVLTYFAQEFDLVTPNAAAALISLAMTAAAVALALWRSPRTPAGFALSCGMVLMTFFLFNKQAFTNYYYLVFACLCAAAAVAGSTPAPSPLPVPKILGKFKVLPDQTRAIL